MTLDRLFENCIPEPNTGCWLWMGGMRWDGYGVTVHNGKNVSAHRLAFEFSSPERFDPTLGVCHSCDIKSCINPHHLWQGTQKENGRDMAIKCRGRRSVSGMPYGVSKVRGRFAARPRILGHVKCCGIYDTAEEAASVALSTKMKYLTSVVWK